MTEEETVRLQKPELEDLLENGERRIQPLKEDGTGFKDKVVTIKLTEDVETEKEETWSVGLDE